MSAERPKAAPAGRLQSHPLLHDHPIAWRISLTLWALSALLFVILAVPALADAVQTIDDAVYRWALRFEWDPAVVAAKVLDVIGSVPVAWPLMIIVAGWLAWLRRWEAFASWLTAMVLSQLLIGPMKELYMRARPLLPLVDTTGWSFPSGHSVTGAVMAVAAVIVLIPAGPRRRNYEMLAAAFAVVMALSRVYLRAHWLTDAAAGAALGAAIAIAVAAVVHRIDDRRQGRDHRSHVR